MAQYNLMTKSLVTVKGIDARGKAVSVAFDQASDQYFSLSFALASDGINKMAQ